MFVLILKMLVKINPLASFDHLAFLLTETHHFEEHKLMLFMKTEFACEVIQHNDSALQTIYLLFTDTKA